MTLLVLFTLPDDAEFERVGEFVKVETIIVNTDYKPIDTPLFEYHMFDAARYQRDFSDSEILRHGKGTLNGRDFTWMLVLDNYDYGPIYALMALTLNEKNEPYYLNISISNGKGYQKDISQYLCALTGFELY